MMERLAIIHMDRDVGPELNRSLSRALLETAEQLMGE
jgi:hypothetical protein